MKYLNPRPLLKVNETELYDTMLKTSRLIREAAEGGVVELHEIMVGEILPLDSPIPEKARAGLQQLLTYMFTCGVAFAVDQQVKNAVKVVQDLQKN